MSPIISAPDGAMIREGRMAPLPTAEQVRRAVDIYLKTAFTGPLPSRLGATLQTIGTCQHDLLACQCFVRTEGPVRYALRLGNPHYPHMKLIVEQSPDESSWLFRVDTHDRHACPKETSPEYGAFCELMSKNQKLAGEIEAAWEAAGVPTFKHFLREDLKRRTAAKF
jgi:hypothetical protein